MDRQSFHTSLLGGFRKKDVVAYLAEERQRQRQELEELQEKLAALEHSAADTESQDRADRLEEELRQLQNAKVVGADREEQLRVLCRRLERSLELLDRAMDGPHHMVCYPVTEEDKTLLRQSGVILGSVPQETPAQPAEPQPAQPDKKPPEEPGDATVSRLMEKVRGWRK